MGDIATRIGAPTNILKTGSVAWTAVDGTEQLSTAIPIAYEEPTIIQGMAGICLSAVFAISGGAGDGNIGLDIYNAADNVTKDTAAIDTNTIAYTVAGTPAVWSQTFRVDELGPAIIVGAIRDSGDRVIAITLLAYPWFYTQVMG